MGQFYNPYGSCWTHDKWKLTLTGVAGPQWCWGKEGYTVEVKWVPERGLWEGGPPSDEHASWLQCGPHPDKGRIWTAMIMGTVKTNGQNECICILQGQGDSSSMHCLNGGTLEGIACSCHTDHSKIVVSPA